MANPEKQAFKRAYEPPILTIYGTVHRMTRMNAPKRGRDGGVRASGTGVV